MQAHQKFLLSITEASEYFNIGDKILRRIANKYPEVAIQNGRKYLFIRHKMEEYFDELPVDDTGKRSIDFL